LSDDPERVDERWKLWALQAAVWLGGRLPRSASYALARLTGDLAYRFRAATRQDVLDNMRHVMGVDAPDYAVEAAAREAFRNVARYYVDLIRLPHTTSEQLLAETVRIDGLDKLKSRMAAGQGVVVATAHFGNPEIAVQVGAVLGLNLLILAEPLQPPAFARLMKRIRATFKPRYVDVGFGGVAETLRHLRAAGCLAITCDRDIQHNGELVPFFGVKARMPLGAVELAARTGAALIPGYCKRRGRGFDIVFQDPVELVDTGQRKEDALVNARALLARVEPWIRADPGQWMVLDRIWEEAT
jgi:KDO2-lipid IV(A) lauroyltransferase